MRFCKVLLYIPEDNIFKINYAKMRNIVKKAPTLYLHASFNLQQSWVVCVAASVLIIVVTSWKGVDSPWLHGIWNAVWIGLEKSGKRAKLTYVLNVHFHLLGAHSTFSNLFTLFHSHRWVVIVISVTDEACTSLRDN